MIAVGGIQESSAVPLLSEALQDPVMQMRQLAACGAQLGVGLLQGNVLLLQLGHEALAVFLEHLDFLQRPGSSRGMGHGDDLVQRGHHVFDLKGVSLMLRHPDGAGRGHVE